MKATRRQQGHREREVQDAERQHREHVQQRRPRARVGEHVADAAQDRLAALV
jgi:hypothetical protein